MLFLCIFPVLDFHFYIYLKKEEIDFGKNWRGCKEGVGEKK